MMEVRNIHKRFGKQEVLKGIDMDVAKGEVVTLLGPSGSGKTTFLRCLNFLERADEAAFSWEKPKRSLIKPIRKRFWRTNAKPRWSFKIMRCSITRQRAKIL